MMGVRFGCLVRLVISACKMVRIAYSMHGVREDTGNFLIVNQLLYAPLLAGNQ